MNLEIVVAILAFIAGGIAVNYLTSRSSGSKDQAAEPQHPPEPVHPFPEPQAQVAAEATAQGPSGCTREEPFSFSGLGSIPVTVGLIAICLAVAALSSLGAAKDVLAPLYIANPYDPEASPILHGEVWRLITPAFIHFGAMHLIFNLIWLWDLGALLERKKGHLFVFGFVLAVGIAANLAQYLVTGSPNFGGMSGVIYGFLGYVWMQGRVNPRFGVVLSQQTVIIMLGWFALCWLGVLGPIANWAHTAGLLMGVALGAMKPGRA